MSAQGHGLRVTVREQAPQWACFDPSGPGCGLSCAVWDQPIGFPLKDEVHHVCNAGAVQKSEDVASVATLGRAATGDAPSSIKW